MEQAIISAVTHDTDEAKITLTGVPDRPGIVGQVFRSLADNDINVDVIVQNVSEHGVTDISFTVPHGDFSKAMALCREHAPSIGAGDVQGDPDIASVSVVGAGMKTHPGVAATVFETLAKEGINIEMISTSAIRVSCVVDQEQVEQAAEALHAAFGLAAGPALVD